MEEAIGCFNEMLGVGCKPDVAVYTCLIVGFGNQGKMDIVWVVEGDEREWLPTRHPHLQCVG